VKAIGVIPTRYASIRFPGNSLKKILRKPLLQWVIEGARQSKLLSEICDDALEMSEQTEV